jgi:VTC domain
VYSEQREAGAKRADEYELKFMVSLERARAFLGAMRDRLHVTVYDPAWPVAFARTTYLDTLDWRYLRSSGADVWRRLRIRQYAGAPDDGVPARLTGLCFLEYKESAASRRRKARLRIFPQDIAVILRDPQASLTAYRHRDTDAVDVLLREMAGATLAPQLMTWYRRQSLGDAGGRVRVTVDTEIAFCLPFEPALMSGLEMYDCGPAQAVGQAPPCLLEIKYDRAPPDWLVAAVRMLGAPPVVRLSKYVMGMQLLDRARHPGRRTAGPA